MTAARGWIVHRFERVTSTMDVAAHLAQLGAPERTVVMALEQTAGRGRGDRRWVSPPGANLYCTILLRPIVTPECLSTLPLIAGVAVAEAIEQTTRQRALLKWPNDVWLGTDAERRKVSGILVSSRLSAARVEFAMVGVGINIDGLPDALPPGGTSLLAASGVQTTPHQVFQRLLDRFDRSYAAYCDARGRPSLADWKTRAALLGEVVTIENAGRVHSGVFIGVDDEGALLLEEPGAAIRKIVAGDMVRGPRVTIS